MLNAIFGNLFRNTSAQNQYAEMSTQTSDENAGNEETLVSVANASGENENNNEKVTVDTSNDVSDVPLDWVLVDASDGENQEEEGKKGEAQNLQNDSNGLITSEENKSKEEEKPMKKKKEETWLITPLPCLTSITCSQRSIIENDPLENLLIEHPSMSVFISAGTTSSFIVPSSATIVEEEDILSEEMYKEVSVHREQKKEKKQKRKETSQGQSSEQNEKKGKKSASKNNKNKENMQVKNLLLLNEFKKPNLTVTRNDLASINRNQMKRFNNAASLRNANANQRKYHKLQQPVVANNFQQY